LREADIQRRSEEAKERAQLDREKELNDQVEAQTRLGIQQEALNQKTRVAEERIQTQRDIAALNNMTKGR